MAEILPIRYKTLSNKSINQSNNQKTCCMVSESSLQKVKRSEVIMLNFLRQYLTGRILQRILYCDQLRVEPLVGLEQI